MRSRRNRTIQSPIVLSACVCAIRSSDLTAVSGPLPAPQQQRPRTGVPFRAPSCARPRLARTQRGGGVRDSHCALMLPQVNSNCHYRPACSSSSVSSRPPCGRCNLGLGRRHRRRRNALRTVRARRRGASLVRRRACSAEPLAQTVWLPLGTIAVIGGGGPFGWMGCRHGEQSTVCRCLRESVGSVWCAVWYQYARLCVWVRVH